MACLSRLRIKAKRSADCSWRSIAITRHILVFTHGTVNNSVVVSKADKSFFLYVSLNTLRCLETRKHIFQFGGREDSNAICDKQSKHRRHSKSTFDAMDNNNDRTAHDQHDGNGIFGQVAKVIPYFRKKRNVLLFKLDIMLLLWMFVAGVSDTSH